QRRGEDAENLAIHVIDRGGHEQQRDHRPPIPEAALAHVHYDDAESGKKEAAIPAMGLSSRSVEPTRFTPHSAAHLAPIRRGGHFRAIMKISGLRAYRIELPLHEGS